MRLFKVVFIAAVSIGLFGCSGSDDSDWRTVKGEGFEIDVPEHLDEMPDLNGEAALQYGYVEETGEKAREHYLIVLMETKEEIASYELDLDFDAMSYRDISVESLRDGLDSYEVLTKEPKVENVNGMDCVVNEMKGALGDIDVYYQLGVFEGESAFYQVLTWTVEDQKTDFKSDMNKSIYSFKEL